MGGRTARASIKKSGCLRGSEGLEMGGGERSYLVFDDTLEMKVSRERARTAWGGGGTHLLVVFTSWLFLQVRLSRLNGMNGVTQ